jgi:uncharacterized protein (TIRG00374 family)
VDGDETRAPSVWAARLKHWWPRMRLVASVGMLGYLLHSINLHDLAPKWDSSTFLFLGIAIFFTTVGIVMSAVRWQRLLVAMDLRFNLRRLLNIYWASQFLSNFMPSSIGGDVLRVTRLSANSEESRAAGDPEAPTAFASVVLDRMSGWLILPLLCLAGLAINPTLLHLGRSSGAAVLTSVVALVTLVLVIAAAASPRIGGRLTKHQNWVRFFGAVHLGVSRIWHRPRAALIVIATSIVYQLVIIAAGAFAAHALDIHVGPTAFLAFIPAVAIIQVLPISVGGLGVREGAFVLFLHPLGVATEKAIALGLCMYAMHLLASLLGAPSFAVGRRSPRTA